MYIATGNGAGIRSGKERRNHATRARGRPDMRASALEGLLQLTRFWTGAGSQPKSVQMDALNPKAIFESLQEGVICIYGEWTLRGIPTRAALSLDGGEDLWCTSLSVASIHGFRTLSGMGLKSAQEACDYIRRREHEIRKQKYVETRLVGDYSLI